MREITITLSDKQYEQRELLADKLQQTITGFINDAVFQNSVDCLDFRGEKE